MNDGAFPDLMIAAYVYPPVTNVSVPWKYLAVNLKIHSWILL